MTEQHFAAFLEAAETKKADKGWREAQEGRSLTLYAGHDGASLTVSRVEAVKLDGELVHAKTVRGELFVLALSDIYGGAVDSPPKGARKAGFVSG